jgi:nitrite reductase/ring-hydroxylating ferredoxin subunit
MIENQQTVPIDSLPPGTVAACGDYVVGNIGGAYFALDRWCRHRKGDLADGSIDAQGCLVCPLHGARYDVNTGQVVEGPRIPGKGLAKRMMNRRPLERKAVEINNGTLFVR